MQLKMMVTLGRLWLYSFRYVQFINDTQPPLEISSEQSGHSAYVGVKQKEKEKVIMRAMG